MKYDELIIQIRDLRRVGHIGSAFLSECILYITLFCNFFILLGNPIQNTVMVSVATHVLLIAVIVVGIGFVIKSFVQGVDEQNILFSILFVAAVFVSLASDISKFAEKLPNLICFLMLPVYIIASHYSEEKISIKRWIYFFGAIYSILFIALYFSKYAYIGYDDYGEFTSEVVTLGYVNPNETGMYVFIAFFICVIAFLDIKAIFFKCVFGLLSGAVFYLTVLIGSRTCIILSVIFILTVIFKLYKRIDNKIKNIVLISPIIALAIIIIFQSILVDFKILGEVADSNRSIIYKDALSSLNFIKFIFGNFKDFGGSNLHNSYLSIFIEYGTIVFIVFYAFLSKSISSHLENTETDIKKIIIASILCVILHGTLEGAFLISGTVYAGLFGMLFLLLPEK